MSPTRASHVLLAAVLLVSVATACGPGASGRVDDDSLATSTAALQPVDAWVATLPGEPGQVVLGDSVTLRGCTYTAGSVRELPPFPPRYWAFVERSGEGPHCRAGAALLGWSYSRPSVAIAAGYGQLVADYTVRYTPSGEAHWHLFIAELSPATGQVLRLLGLSAMSPSPDKPSLGNVYDGALEVRPAGGLVVTGEKNGLIPGEVGSGTHYRAEYEHVLVGPEDAPPTVSITAW